MSETVIDRSNPDIALLCSVWEARASGDLATMEAGFAPDAKWRAIYDGPWNCNDRSDIMAIMRQNIAQGLDGVIEEATPLGERILVAFRPKQPWRGDRPLDNGLAYIVVTVSDGAITEMKGCIAREHAVAYATTGKTTEPRDDIKRPPDTTAPPPAHRVSRLVPFIRVADITQSIAWYQHLGFTSTSIFTPRRRLTWTAMSSEGAELMLQQSEKPTRDPRGIVLWLYTHDLVALRNQLIERGVDAGPLVDGAPGPPREMELTDPDGYTVMVAEIEESDMIFERSALIASVRDVDVALARYQRLGFATELDKSAHYGFAERGGVQLHLQPGEPGETGGAVYLYVSDADALHAEWTSAGVDGKFIGPHDTPYGLREFVYIDPDGIVHKVGSPL